MSDLQADLSANVGQTLAALKSVEDRILRIEAATKRANAASKDHQREVSKGYKEAGEAISKAGGEGIGKIIKSGGMEGIFGRIAVYGLAARTAWELIAVGIENSISKAELFLQATEKITEATNKALETRKQQAAAGESLVPGRKSLLAAGGDNAVGQAEIVVQSGLATLQEATQAVSAIYGKFGDTTRARNAVTVASLVARGGGSFAEAAQGTLHAGAALDATDNARRLAGRLFKKQTGRIGGGDGVDQLYESIDRISNDPASQRFAQVSDIKNKTNKANLNTFIEGGTDKPHEELAAAIDPLSKNLVDLNLTTQKQIAALETLAKAQGTLGAIMANIGLLSGGKGSYENQIRKLNIQNARAAGLPTDDAPASGSHIGNTGGAEAFIP